MSRSADRPTALSRYGPKHTDYQLALGLINGVDHAELAAQLGVTQSDLLARSMSDEVREAERRLLHLHKFGPPAAKGMLIDALPEFLEVLMKVIVDPKHKAWQFAAKLYIDRVLPVVDHVVAHHTHEVDAVSRQALMQAGAALDKLVTQLGPKVLELQAVDVTPRVLVGEAARPAPFALPQGDPAPRDSRG